MKHLHLSNCIKFLCFCISVASLTVAFHGSTIAEEFAVAVTRPIHIDDPRFLVSPPQGVLDQFILDDDGIIIDGPRAAEGEPIDYTDLMTNETILWAFGVSVFGCADFEEGCEFQNVAGNLKKWPKGSLTVYAHYDNVDTLGIVRRSYFWQQFAEIYQQINIDLSDGKFETSQVYVFIGSKDYLTRIGKDVFPDDVTTQQAVSFLTGSEIQEHNNRHRKIFNAEVHVCISSWLEDDSGFISQSRLLFFVNDLSNCAPRTIFMSLGFVDSTTVFSSVLQIDAAYKNLTKLDKLFLDILYSDRLVPGSKLADAMPIVRELLEEYRPND